MLEEAEKVVEELRKKEQEDKDKEELDNDTTQDNLTDPPSSSSGTITSDHVRLSELGLLLFTPSRYHAMACLDTIFFDKNRKTIVRISEKRLKIDTQPSVITVTEKTMVEKTNQEPKFLALVSIAATQANANNVDKLMEDADHYK